ncbi:MAG: TIGR00295 family protein [Candidatus Bathyarchaeota archaeon]|nr:TIGR00295 family protein [Candidatus Bathyarchaeota archaeon]
MSRHVPSEKAALKILRKAGCSAKVVEHCIKVAHYAAEMAESCRKKGVKVDVELVRIGAILHDIGRARTHTVNHSIVGAQLARELNLSTSLVSIIENHVGTGINESEAEKLGWPMKSYIPKTLEERIVAYADKLISGSTLMTIDMALNRFRRENGVSNDAVERLKLWHEELSNCIG